MLGTCWLHPSGSVYDTFARSAYHLQDDKKARPATLQKGPGLGFCEDFGLYFWMSRLSPDAAEWFSRNMRM